MRLRRKRLLWVLAAAVLAAAAPAYWLLRSLPSLAPRSARPLAIRTVRVRSGQLERTLRLTGTTAPERFAALLAPQLRGSRRGPSATVAPTTTTSAATASTPSTSQSTSTASSSSTTATSSSTSQVSGAAGGTLSGGNLATALNRFSTPTSTTATQRTNPAAATPVTSTQDLGSTSSSLIGGGGGGGGGDWDLILQKVLPPGTPVHKGEVIAEFDRQYQLLRLDDYRANLDQQNEGLKSLQANLEVDKKAHLQSIETAKANLEKARYDLKTIPVQSDIAAEQLRLAEQEAAMQYKQLQAQVKYKDISQKAEYRSGVLERDQSNIEYGRAQANADRMLVKASIDGVTVMSSAWRAGEMAQIQAGDELHPGQMFMRVVDSRSMVIEATVNQVDIEQLRLGLPARVRFDAYPELELTARVHALAAMPKTGGFRASFVKEVPVVLKLDRLDPRVIPDLSVSVDVVLASEPQATLAPREAIFFEDGRAYAFVASGGGFERRELELGLMNNVAAVVRSGLAPGERIAVERPRQERP